MREDYSADGNAWDYFPHDHARSRVYRWNEDGIAGIFVSRNRILAVSPAARMMPLSLDEFLRRFLLHLLPKGFVRIRHFGFLANRRRATLLPLCFQLLGPIPQPQIEPVASAAEQPSPLYRCPANER